MRPKIDVIERVKKLGIWKGREQGLASYIYDAEKPPQIADFTTS
jgi:hypothetical protein